LRTKIEFQQVLIERCEVMSFTRTSGRANLREPLLALIPNCNSQVLTVCETISLGFKAVDGVIDNSEFSVSSHAGVGWALIKELSTELVGTPLIISDPGSTLSVF
jgi:hypothetical protein